jgi:hypothetical protein
MLWFQLALLPSRIGLSTSRPAPVDNTRPIEELEMPRRIGLR